MKLLVAAADVVAGLLLKLGRVWLMHRNVGGRGNVPADGDKTAIIILLARPRILRGRASFYGCGDYLKNMKTDSRRPHTHKTTL